MTSELVSNGYFIGNIVVTLLYAVVFIFMLIRILIKPVARNFFAVSVAVLYLMMGFIFLMRATMNPYPLGHSHFEFVWFLVALLPPILFLLFRRQSFTFGVGDAVVSTDRFNKLKDEFLTVASHELRTPLAVINGFAEVLVREKVGPLNDEQKRRVRKILMQGQRLNRIIDDLLDLSRIRSGKLEVRQDIFDLVPVLKACLDDHQILCDQQSIQLEDKIPDVLPDIVGDLERVTQIVVNLLNNSIKYTDGGGTIILTAFYDREHEKVRVEVQDTGIGIDPKDQARVFEEFFRADHHRARKYSGSGLGLAIVQQLVEAQGGTVGLESAGVGKGSRFFFTLPAVKQPAKLSPKLAL